MTEDRGALFVQQENLEDKIKSLLQDLHTQGQILAEFGSALKTAPAAITFPNAPHGLGAAPIEVIGRSPFEWSQLEKASSLTSLAQTIQELRQAQQDLATVRQSLARR